MCFAYIKIDEANKISSKYICSKATEDDMKDVHHMHVLVNQSCTYGSITRGSKNHVSFSEVIHISNSAIFSRIIINAYVCFPADVSGRRLNQDEQTCDFVMNVSALGLSRIKGQFD